jgi:putative DNA primase/helicase
MHEAIEQFRAAIRDSGLPVPEVIEPDGKLHRFPSNGKPSDDAGWYVFYDGELPAGAFGDWRTGVSETWHANTGRRLSSQEAAAHRVLMDSIRREREADDARRRAEARERAAHIWEQATSAPDDHPYLLRKRIKAHGVRVNDGALVIPVRDTAGDLHSLQFVDADGEKRFLRGGRVSGCYFAIGKPARALCIAEGYATAASIHEATGLAVAVAFNAGNLMSVATALRSKFPKLRLIICADDDATTEGNPGLTRARAAAQAVEGVLAIPNFGADRPEGATDFNDLHRHAGTQAVQACIEPVAVHQSGTAPVIFRCLSEVELQPIKWLWRGRFARGKVSMIAGHPGLGKSQVTTSLAAIVTTAGRWPVDGGFCDLGSVVILSAEDDAADTIKPRLLAAGADIHRCYILDAVTDLDVDGTPRARSFNLQSDLDRLAGLLEHIGDVALVVIDPISAYLGGVDSHKNAEVRAVLAPLAELAARYGVAVACVSHLNKGGPNEALMRVTGSLAFVAAARAAYIVARDNDDEQRRLFLPLKNNLANDQVGLAFRLESVQLDAGVETSRVMWETEPVTVTADEAMQSAEPDDERSQRDEITAWLKDLLYPGRMKSQEVQSKAKQSGFAWRTVQRTAKDNGVVMKREGFGPDTVTYWSLPTVAPGPTSRASSQGVARADGFGATDDMERGEL